MIGRLRRRMTLLVTMILILVTAGIIFSINYANWRQIVMQAEEILDRLAENNGKRPSRKSGEERKLPEIDVPPPEGTKGRQPPGLADTLVDLSNSYQITLPEDNEVTGWTSERADLYSDEQIEEFAAAALAESRSSGRIGTQFYRFLSEGKTRMLLVLDQRLEIMRARSVLRMSCAAAGIACLLLCLGAYFLIRVLIRPVQEAFDRQRQFVSDASHELKTPLAVISANAQVLREEIGENEHLEYTLSEVRRSDRLVKNLLELARLDQKKYSAQMGPVDLSKAILEVTLPFESTAFEAGHRLEIQVPEDIWCIGNADMLKQLTVILLSNAVKYSVEGGEIFLSLTARGHVRELKVVNMGEPIPKEDLERIFDRFYRRDSSHARDVEGFGLGLSLADAIAKAHKGKITAKSTQEGETSFTVTLPGTASRSAAS